MLHRDDALLSGKPDNLLGCYIPHKLIASPIATGVGDTLPDNVPGNPALTQPVIIGTTFEGWVSPDDDVDFVSVSLVAGQTYSISLRGTGNDPLSDSLLGLYDSAGTLLISDDDGGEGTWSLINFTATTTGTYYISAESFSAPEQEPEGGQYRIDVNLMGADAVPDTLVGAVELDPGEVTFGFIESAATGPYGPTYGEVDTYKLEVEAGKIYTISIAGGASDWFSQGAGELDTVLVLYDENGNYVGENDDINFPGDVSSSISFLAEEDGTFYIDAFAYDNATGGYTINVTEVDLADVSPLDAIDWKSSETIDPGSDNIATVYFAPAGENFGETGDDGVSPAESFGWSEFAIQQVMTALEEYTKILGIEYQITNSAEDATFRLYTTTSTQFGAYFYPQDPAFGTQQGVGAFNVDSGGWSLPGQPGLQQGGFDFGVVLHEFGHAHGLAHAHDNGGGSDVMLGVTATTGSYGVYDLNQGVYTVMSYNDGWDTGPNGPSPFTIAGVDSGWSGTLSAFDIAMLQEKYDVRPDYATGSDTYVLQDTNDVGTYYSTIYDTGGNDTIAYNGIKDARIDLTAATIDYSPTGGGVVSFVDTIFGGYTIANGVVIENATGGGGEDVLIGNEVANILSGNGAADTLMGRAGKDTLIGGAGADVLDGGDGLDTASYRTAAAGVIVSLTTPAGNSGDAAGDTFTSIENLEGSGYDDILGGNTSANDFFGGNGNDKVSYALSAGGVLASLSNGTVSPSTTTQTGSAAGDRYNSIETLEGSNFNDTLHAAATGSTLIGLDGTDTLYGLGGSDALYGGVGQDLLIGDGGTDYLYGGNGQDTLRGDAGGDYLYGEVGVDSLDGGAGIDVLDGGVGNDTLTGGAAADVFDINDLGGTDTITDFKRAQGDKIDLRSLAIDEWIGTQAFHNDAGEVRIRNAGAQWWLEGDTNGDGVADFSVALGNVQLQSTDVLIGMPI